MSGIDDGLHLNYSAQSGDGRFDGRRWTISIGRHESNDVCLRQDIFVSRQHAYLHWEQESWSLEDTGSTNGTFVELVNGDEPVTQSVPISPGELFRVGRTWMRIEPPEE